MNKPVSKKKELVENHLDDTTPKWFAIYTHYKREKIAAKDLAKAGIQVYLPTQTLTRHYVRKTTKVVLPLINHYVFVKITRKEYSKVLSCPYVIKFVKFSKNLISIPENEIELIKRILGEAKTVQIDNAQFYSGNEVEVIGGNLTGLKGIIIKKENNQYLSVHLTNIGLSLNVSIAAHLVRNVKPRLLV